jgi:Na+-translocating ferredoxin:NAD+ oxidoreductase RnfD subunit
MIIDLLGWLGAGLILLGYFLVSTKRDKATGVRYQLINLIGGVALIINAYFKGAMPFVFLNSVWVIIAIRVLFEKLSKS